MTRVIITLCIALTCSTVGASQEGAKEKRRYIVVPREVALPVVTSQLDSPLQFEEVRIIRGISGGDRVSFQLRNRGMKAIRSVTYGVATSHGGGWVDSRPRIETSELIMPGGVVPLNEENCCNEIVPLTEELRDKLKLRGQMQAVMVFMVVHVRFADGSTWDDEKTYQALQEHFEKTADALDAEPSPPKKQP